MRYSLENPLAYVQSNIVGFTHVLEACRQAQVAHLTYASTSSVYGANTQHALHRGPGGRPSLAVLRRHQAGERADGARLQPPLPAADHGPALLHRLRPLGAAGHGADALRLGHPRRPADQGLRPRRAEPRLHLHRRHRRGGDPRQRPRRRPRSRLGPGRPGPGHLRRPLPHLQHRQQRPRRPRRLHRRARGRPRQARHPRAPADAARRRARHLRRLDAAGAGDRTGARRRRSRRGWRASWTGTATITARTPRPTTLRRNGVRRILVR